MNKLILLLCIVLFVSCKKEYKYEVWAETGIFSSLADTKESEDIIKEGNDSLAFVKAHGRFIFSMQMRWERNKNFHPEIYYFKLITPEGHNISSGSFLANPNEVRQRNVDIFLTDNFKEYLRSVEN